MRRWLYNGHQYHSLELIWTRSTGPGRTIGQVHWSRSGYWTGPLVQVVLLDKVHWSRSGYWTSSTGRGRDIGQVHWTGPLVHIGILDKVHCPGRAIGQGPLVQVVLLDRSTGPGRNSEFGPLVQIGLLDKVHCPGRTIGQGPLFQVVLLDRFTCPGRDIGQLHWSRSYYWTGPLVQVGIVDRSTGPDIGQVHRSRSGYWTGSIASLFPFVVLSLSSWFMEYTLVASV